MLGDLFLGNIFWGHMSFFPFKTIPVNEPLGYSADFSAEPGHYEMGPQHVELIYRISHTIQEILSFSLDCPITFAAIKPVNLLSETSENNSQDNSEVTGASICLYSPLYKSYTVICLPLGLLKTIQEASDSSLETSGMDSRNHLTITPDLSICLKQMGHAFQKECMHIFETPFNVTLPEIFKLEDKKPAMAFSLLFETGQDEFEVKLSLFSQQ